MSKGGRTDENPTMPEVADPPEKVSSSTDSELGDDDASTKATEENDSDTTMGSPDTKKEATSDAETEADDSDGKTQEEKDKESKEAEEAEKKRIEELKIKYKDWPLKDIKEPHENDVMYGRGGGTNHHPGNKRYRSMVESRKVKYVNSKRLDKPLVALEIIREWRAQLPPGRFLKHNDKTGCWDDVGDKKAREKTSQALREKAPQIRAQQEEEEKGDDEKTTRFAEGTKGNKKGTSKLKKAILARDHSLGREYLASDENVDLEGFTWQDPFKKEGGREASTGSAGPPSAAVLPPGRESSTGSVGSFFSNMAYGQPPAPDFHGRVFFDTRREVSNSSLASFNQPYMPAPPGAPHHQRSGSWTHPQQPPPPHTFHHQRSGSWGGGRDHSFSMNPLQHTNVNRPAPTGAFDQRAGSGSWGPGPYYGPSPGPQHGPHPPPPPPSAYPPFAYQSGSSIGTIGSAGGSPYRQVPPSTHSTPSPTYDPMGVAKAWSGGGGPHPQGPYGPSQYEGHLSPVSGANTSPQRGAEAAQHPPGHLPRPGIVKRDTSNQNESYETKPSRIKKAALNRDQSATSNRLKQQYIPEVFNRDMQSLHEKTEKIRLSSPVPPDSGREMPKPPKPQMLDMNARQSTVDAMEQAMTDFLFTQGPPQPAPLSEGDRKNTMDELGYDLIGDSDAPKSPPASLSKPAKLTAADRLTTTEFNEIVNAPFEEIIDKTDDGDAPLPL
mmetsp:Transcript_8753/g.21550  ORF Transcript_8753/g.21550 Transcript_8753/m.21550 type:complete len:721 (-) Transcript_8753:206-2368(-)